MEYNIETVDISKLYLNCQIVLILFFIFVISIVTSNDENSSRKTIYKGRQPSRDNELQLRMIHGTIQNVSNLR